MTQRFANVKEQIKALADELPVGVTRADAMIALRALAKLHETTPGADGVLLPVEALDDFLHNRMGELIAQPEESGDCGG